MAEKKSSGYTYIGPAHFIEHEGKLIEPGEPLPLDEAAARRLRRLGHIIGGLEDEPVAVGAVTGQGNLKQQQALEELHRQQGQKPQVTDVPQATVEAAEQVRQEQTEQAKA